MRGCKLAMVRNLALPLYGRTQKSGLAEVIPLICISLSGANSLCFHTISFLRALHGVWLQSDSCAWLILWFLPEFPEVSLTQLTGSCNHWWLWHPLFTDMVGIILFFSLIGYHRILSRVPCAIQQVPSAKLPVLASHHLSPLVTIRLFVFFFSLWVCFLFFFVCLFVFAF